MDQAATLTTGWEPGTPPGDSVVRQFAFACTAGSSPAPGYGNAAILLQPPARTALPTSLNRARQLFPPDR